MKKLKAIKAVGLKKLRNVKRIVMTGMSLNPPKGSVSKDTGLPNKYGKRIA